MLKLRKLTKSFATLTIEFLVAFSPALCCAQTAAPQQTEPAPVRPAVHSHRPVVRDTTPTSALCATCVQSNLSYLAGPALHGRGSGTEDEHHAAQFIADKLKLYGLTPAAENGEFIQTATLRSREVIGNPTLTIETPREGNSKPLVLIHGKQIVISGLSQPEINAPLQKLDLNDVKTSPADVTTGAAVLIKLKPGTTMEDSRTILAPYRSGKTTLVIVASSPGSQKMFDTLSKNPPSMPEQVGDEPPPARAALVLSLIHI